MMEATHFLGVVLSLGAALAGAVQYLFLRIGTEDGRANDAVLVVMLMNVLLLLPAVLVLYYPSYGLTWVSWLSFAAAGILGTLLGRVCAFTSIDRIGASRTMPIVASWAMISTVLGVVVLGESLSSVHAIGVMMVVGGVGAIAWETSQENPSDLSRRALALGLVIPLLAALAYGWEPIFASFGLEEGTPAPVGLTIKTVAATLGFTIYLRWSQTLPGRVQLRSRSMRWFVAAGACNTLFLLGYYLALEIAPVSIVAPIIVTNTLFMVVLSALFMPNRLEAVTGKLAIAATVVLAGVMLITVYG